MDDLIIIQELTKILRQNPKDDVKRDIVFALAHTNEEVAVQELIGMLYQNIYGYVHHEKSWKTLWKSRKIYYNYPSPLISNPLIAIEALGETKNKKSLECLENLISKPIEIKNVVMYEPGVEYSYLTGHMEYSAPYPVEGENVIGMHFGNMPESLECYFKSDTTNIQDYLKWVEKKPEYQLIKKSIEKLKNSLGEK